MRARLVQLAGVALVVVLLCLGGWFVLRSTGSSEGAVPAPIAVPARESGTVTPPSQPSPAPVPPPPGPVPPPQAPGPTDVVPPPPAVDDDDDDDDADVGEDDGDDD